MSDYYEGQTLLFTSSDLLQLPENIKRIKIEVKGGNGGRGGNSRSNNNGEAGLPGEVGNSLAVETDVLFPNLINIYSGRNGGIGESSNSYAYRSAGGGGGGSSAVTINYKLIAQAKGGDGGRGGKGTSIPSMGKNGGSGGNGYVSGNKGGSGNSGGAGGSGGGEDYVNPLASISEVTETISSGYVVITILEIGKEKFLIRDKEQLKSFMNNEWKKVDEDKGVSYALQNYGMPGLGELRHEDFKKLDSPFPKVLCSVSTST